jgi:hypothetical protein
MSLTLRNINNLGEPLCAPDGTVLAGVAITFTLINEAGLAIDAWDGTTFERVAGIKTVTTNNLGQFSIDIWPNDRGSEVTYYLCHVASASIRDFTAALPSGGTGITWVQFMGGATPMPPVPPDALALHVASPTAHPNATQSLNGFMSSADKAKLDLLPGGGSIGLAFTALAGEALSGHQAVVLAADGMAYRADRATASNMGRVAGITLNAAALGASVNIMRSGQVIEPSWSWTPFLPIFLGHLGALTQVAPTDGFLIVLGSALDATSMFVNPNPPLVIT